MRPGVAGYAALPALGSEGRATKRASWPTSSGPLAYAAIMERNRVSERFSTRMKPTLRRIVEGNSGHDTPTLS